ncbi:hypothetical protein H0W26_05440 [Candidatus Dependentiae bacterium]|nr:hypothetical protein [Candidatus Dependentiae bacterium]
MIGYNVLLGKEALYYERARGRDYQGKTVALPTAVEQGHTILKKKG